jgi:hypothetical protein
MTMVRMGKDQNNKISTLKTFQKGTIHLDYFGTDIVLLEIYRFP